MKNLLDAVAEKLTALKNKALAIMDNDAGEVGLVVVIGLLLLLMLVAAM